MRKLCGCISTAHSFSALNFSALGKKGSELYDRLHWIRHNSTTVCRSLNDHRAKSGAAIKFAIPMHRTLITRNRNVFEMIEVVNDSKVHAPNNAINYKYNRAKKYKRANSRRPHWVWAMWNGYTINFIGIEMKANAPYFVRDSFAEAIVNTNKM